jgi:hypothetical protein
MRSAVETLRLCNILCCTASNISLLQLHNVMPHHTISTFIPQHRQAWQKTFMLRCWPPVVNKPSSQHVTMHNTHLSFSPTTNHNSNSQDSRCDIQGGLHSRAAIELEESELPELWKWPAQNTTAAAAFKCYMHHTKQLTPMMRKGPNKWQGDHQCTPNLSLQHLYLSSQLHASWDATLLCCEHVYAGQA